MTVRSCTCVRWVRDNANRPAWPTEGHLIWVLQKRGLCIPLNNDHLDHRHGYRNTARPSLKFRRPTCSSRLLFENMDRADAERCRQFDRTRSCPRGTRCPCECSLKRGAGPCVNLLLELLRHLVSIWVTEPELLAIKRCRRCMRGRLGGRRESYSTGGDTTVGGSKLHALCHA